MNDRLFRTIQLLMKYKHMTARQLAEELEVSTRTIYRDLDSLTLAGIPIYTQKGENGGIYIDESYVLSSSLINAQEQASILQGLKLLESVNIRDTQASSEKLEALFKQSVPEIIKIDFHAWGKDDEQEFLFDSMFQAIVTHHLVKFTYYNSMKEKSERMVEPYQLVFKQQSWYLHGFCLAKQDYRIFKFHRMVDLVVLDDEFIPRPFVKEEIPVLDYPSDQEVVLHFNKGIWFQLVDHFSVAMIHELDDCFEVRLNCPDEDWLLSWLISFEDQLEIISPQSLRDRLYKLLKNMTKIYE